MIVKRRWMTEEQVKVGTFNWKYTKWSGWFLFGVILLYKRADTYEYRTQAQ